MRLRDILNCLKPRSAIEKASDEEVHACARADKPTVGLGAMRMAVSLYRVLIDTSVWLDMAGSYRAAPLVRALHEMCDNAQLEIIVPDIVREEFARNKDRVATQSTKALQSHLKSLRYALTGHADQDIAKQALDVLQGIDFRTLLKRVASWIRCRN